MKDKKINYVLLPLALLIWGYTIYYFIKSYNKENASPKLSEAAVIAGFRSESFADTFSLLLNYPDPFTKKNKEAKIVSVKKTLQLSPKQEIPMPSIIYKGCISKQGSGNKIGIFKIDGKEVLLKEGSESKGIKIMKLTPKDATIVLRNKKQTLPLQGKN